MQSPAVKRYCAMLVLSAFLFMIVGVPRDLKADVNRWPRKDLPSTSLTTLIIVGVCVGLIVGLLITSSGDKEKEKKKEEKEEEEKKEEGEEKAGVFDSPQNYHRLANLESGDTPISFYLGIRNNEVNDIDTKRFDSSLSNRTVVLGLTLKF